MGTKLHAGCWVKVGSWLYNRQSQKLHEGIQKLHEGIEAFSILMQTKGIKIACKNSSRKDRINH
jgi:hypothetical protein